MLDNAFYITVMFIGLSTFVGMIIKKLHRDKCLKDFAGYMVTLEGNDGKDVWGKLRVENTGIELAYPEKQTDAWLRSIVQQLKNVNFIFAIVIGYQYDIRSDA